MRRLHGPLSILLVIVATAAAGAVGLSLWTAERKLSIGEIHLSSDLGHRGSLDLYVPLVDWGVRFGGVRLPVRLSVDVRTIDRNAALRLAQAGKVDVDTVRAEARDAIESYIVRAVLVVAAVALAFGALVAFAVRGPAFPWTIAVAAGTAVLGAGAVGFLLPPRGDLSEPEYYAHGPDIPRALDALRTAAASADTLRDEVDAQLVALARLVTAPAARDGLASLPRATIASDLHNNALALPSLERAARDGLVLFAGDLTDRGSPLETALSRRIARAGRPFVVAPGNHDSDVLLSRLSRAGAVVLGTRGRLRADGSRGDVVVRAGGLRIAGYDDPNMRRRADGYADRGTAITPAQQQAFADWVRPLAERVDVVIVHNPRLIETALDELRTDPPRRPLVFVTGHTHRPALDRIGDSVVVINGGTVGGGGTGNLGEGQPVGLAQLTYRPAPFTPVTADLVEIDPDSGSARAQRQILSGAGTP